MTSTPPAERLRARYGPPRRKVPLGLVAVGVVIAIVVGLFLWFGYRQARDNLRTQVLSYRVVSDSSVHVKFQVGGKPGYHTTCQVVAKAADFSVVGATDVPVELGTSGVVTRSVDVKTTRRAVDGEIGSCLPQAAPGSR